MKLNTRSNILLAALLGAAYPATAATTIANANFDSATIGSGLSALAATGTDNITWTEITPAAASGSIGVVAPGAMNNSVATIVAESTGQFYGIFGAFTNPFPLQTGDSLTVSFDLRLNANPSNSTAGFRYGFGTGNATTGEAAFGALVGTGTDNTFSFGTNTAGNGTGFSQPTNAGTGSGFTGLAAFSNATANTSLTVTKTATGYDFSSTIKGVTYTSSFANSTGVFDNLDGIYFLNGATNNPFQVDNITVVSSVPEISTSLLGSLSGLLLLRRRRHA